MVSHKQQKHLSNSHSAQSTLNPSGDGKHNSTSSTSSKSLDAHAQELRVRYSTEAKSLKDIFSSWAEVDLLYILEEVQGDFDLAVSRITEGHAEQWGEVKSSKKKDKPAAFTAPASASHSGKSRFTTDQFSSDDRSTAFHSRGPSKPTGDDTEGQNLRGNSAFRGGRGGGRGGRGGSRGGRGGGRGGSTRSGGDRFSSMPVQSEGGAAVNAWGSTDENVRSFPPESAPESSGECDTETTEVNAWAPAATGKTRPASSLASTTAAKQQSASATKALASTSAKSVQSKTSWAQLVRGPDPVVVPVSKPVESHVPAPVPSEKLPSKQKAAAFTSKKDASPARSVTATSTIASVVASAAVSVHSSPVAKQVVSPMPEPKATTATAVNTLDACRSPAAPVETALALEQSAPTQIADTTAHSTAPPLGLRQQHAPRAQAPRKLKQDQAVVMPSNAQLGSIGVQFGSLRVGNVEPESALATTTTTTFGTAGLSGSDKQQSHSSPKYQHQSASARISNAASPTAPVAASVATTAPTSFSRHHQQQSDADHAVSAAGLHQQPHQHVSAGAPGLPGMMAYGSYFPSQHANAFGHPGAMPTDYNTPYVSDPARAASMGHFGHADPGVYAHGIATAKYQSEAPVPSSQVTPQQQHLAMPHQQTTLAGPQTTMPTSQPTSHQHHLQQQQLLQQQQAQNAYYFQNYPFPAYYMQNQYTGGYQNHNPLYSQPYAGKNHYPGYVQPTPASSAQSAANGVPVPASGQAGKNTSNAPAGLTGGLSGGAGPTAPNAGGAPGSVSGGSYPYQSGHPNYYQYDDLSGGLSNMQQMDYGKGVNGYGTAPPNFGGFAPNSLGSGGKSNEYKSQNRQSRQGYDGQKYSQQQSQQQQQNSPNTSNLPLQGSTSVNGSHAQSGGNSGNPQASQMHNAPAYYNQQQQYQGGPHPGYQPHMMHHQQQQQYAGTGGYGSGGAGQQRQGYWPGQH
ncbi:RNAPII degradation factor [Batrachochytrium dendrobatidis]|nr:RNAPII degradation factor [Batrachochytrium dendrobatidis]